MTSLFFARSALPSSGISNTHSRATVQLAECRTPADLPRIPQTQTALDADLDQLDQLADAVAVDVNGRVRSQSGGLA